MMVDTNMGDISGEHRLPISNKAVDQTLRKHQPVVFQHLANEGEKAKGGWPAEDQ